MTTEYQIRLDRDACEGIFACLVRDDRFEEAEDGLATVGCDDEGDSETLVATYESEPSRELVDQFSDIDADRVYAVPTCATHTYDTSDELPAALSAIGGEVRYCDPIGRSPAVTDVLADRASERIGEGAETGVVLVGLGSASTPEVEQTAAYHARRLRERGVHDEVTRCYLMQNPAVECARYNVSTDRTVAVPLFVTECEATSERVPAALELDRGGLAYADPFGDHERLTDAIAAEVEKQRALAQGDLADTDNTQRRLTADGEGLAR